VLRVTAHDSTGSDGLDLSDAPFAIQNSQAEVEEASVTEFQLGPMSPNPMRNRVWIEYALPREAPVRLSVCDLQGREIAVLAGGVHGAGRHRALWNGQAEGRNTAPGIYFVRFSRPGKVHFRRLVVLH
jgi:hypothetical protein